MYAWMLCVFTVIMAYSITCPIIVPFGEWPWSESQGRRVAGSAEFPRTTSTRASWSRPRQGLCNPENHKLWLIATSHTKFNFMSHGLLPLALKTETMNSSSGLMASAG